MRNTVHRAPEHPGPGVSQRQPRADARRNRQLILDAAEEVFGERGVGAPVDDIARRAGLGVGTLYRHFPTKEALCAAIITTRLERLVANARAAASAEGDAAESLFGLLSDVIETSALKKDVADFLAGSGYDVTVDAGETYDDLRAAIDRLLRRAQEAGKVRRDVTVADLIGLVSGACVAGQQGWAGPCSTERMWDVVCDGLRSR
jgi:AcrR family transcriptional regulator